MHRHSKDNAHANKSQRGVQVYRCGTNFVCVISGQTVAAISTAEVLEIQHNAQASGHLQLMHTQLAQLCLMQC